MKFAFTSGHLNNSIDFESKHEVANLEVIIPKSKNTAEFINDTLLYRIQLRGFRAIGGEVDWCKNEKNQNVLRMFGATEGRTTLRSVSELLESL